MLAEDANFAGLASLSRALIAKAEALDSGSRTVLDMDSTEIPVYGEQEQSAYNGHFESVCYHPLLLFNRDGDCLAATLRPGNVHSAECWEELLLPEIERQQKLGKEVVFRADAAFVILAGAERRSVAKTGGKRERFWPCRCGSPDRRGARVNKTFPRVKNRRVRCILATFSRVKRKFQIRHSFRWIGDEECSAFPKPGLRSFAARSERYEQALEIDRAGHKSADRTNSQRLGSAGSTNSQRLESADRTNLQKLGGANACRINGCLKERARSSRGCRSPAPPRTRTWWRSITRMGK